MTASILGGRISRRLIGEALQFYTNPSFNRGYLMLCLLLCWNQQPTQQVSGSRSANMDKFDCNNSLVNSDEVSVIQKSAPFPITHLCAFKAWCPLLLFIAHWKKDGGENHIIVRSWQYSSNRRFFHEQYIMNSLESIEALYLYTYKLRKCSHSALLFLLTSATDWWILCKHSPAHIIKHHT